MANGSGTRLPRGDGASDRALPRRMRRINERAGRALEILGHSIDYLADEFLVEFDSAPSALRCGRVEAIQLLMAINRQIYFECPEVPALRERFTAFIPLFRSNHER